MNAKARLINAVLDEAYDTLRDVRNGKLTNPEEWDADINEEGAVEAEICAWIYELERDLERQTRLYTW